MFYIKSVMFFLIYIYYSCINVQASLFTKVHDFPITDDPNHPSTRAEIPIESITMKINHFNSKDKRTFDMRYSFRDDYFNGTGPIFLYIGGESSLEHQLGAMYGGLMHDMAKEKGAYMFVTEHRYYGDSVPNLNLETSNMKELTFAQALADIAFFIKDRKKNITALQNSKVVVVGGSYPANLAAWMRLKYPDVVDAALSSSGVLKIRVNNYEFNEVVQKDLINNTQCLSTIKNAFTTLQKMVKTDKGATKIRKDFGLCEPLQITHKKEIENFFNGLIVKIGTIAQYNKQKIYIDIDTMCNYLIANSTSLDDYTRLANYIHFWISNYGGNGCSESYQSIIGDYKNTGLSDSRPWIYQLCTELGNLVTTDSYKQPYNNTVPISYWYSVCYDTFGIFFSPLRVTLGIAQTKLEYGGVHPNVTKVVFTVGTVDPWSSAGLTEDLNAEAPVIRIKGASHCADLHVEHPDDSIELKNARKKVKNYIYSWI